MEPKQICRTRYDSFITKKLEYYNKYEINELHKIQASFHGWVILSDHPHNVFWSLWNPLTSDLISLPPLIHKQEEESYQCCLSSPPGDLGSLLFLTMSKTPTIVLCRLDSCKDKRLKWSEVSYAKQIQTITGLDDCVLECPTCYNGKVYAMIMDTSIIQLDIVVTGNEIVISLLSVVDIPIPGAVYTRYPSRNTFYAICSFLKGGCAGLFYFNVCFIDEQMVGEVYLFKLDMSSELWEEVEDLVDAMFFLNYESDDSYSIFYTSTAVSDVCGKMHILGEIDNNIYSFHVKDRTVCLSSMPSIVRESQVLVWALLECRLEVDHHDSKQEEHHDKEVEIVRRPAKSCNDTAYDNTSESLLFSFPFHILELIMEHCVGVEYMNFRATCKLCRLAAPTIQWCNKTTLRRLQTHSVGAPWLTVLDIYQCIITFIDPIHGDKYFIKLPEEFKTPREYNADCQIFCSRYGWLLLVFGKHELVFFNPFTHNTRRLPVKRGHVFESLCFSAPPTSPDCIVVGFTSYGPSTHVFIHFVSREPLSWYRHRFDFGTSDPYSFHIPTFSGRDIYALCNDERIDAFRSNGEEGYSWEVVKDKVPKTSGLSPTRHFLSKCDQHLLLVIVAGVFGESVEVFELNECRKEWEKIVGLEQHMIYISETSCICLEAKSPHMGNKIYFPILMENEETKIVFYSLETRKYHTFDDKSIQESFGDGLSGTKYVCHPHTWIEPNWS